jgi:uncharacterized protein YeaO (DUF488 family)
LDRYRDADLSLIAVSYNKPAEAEDVKRITLVAPEKDLIQGVKKGDISWVDFDIAYRQQLADTLDLDLLVKVLACICFAERKRGVILLAYEKVAVKSHRSILADILNKSGLIDTAVEEFKVMK